MERYECLEVLKKTQPLTVAEIKCLYDISEEYIIPYKRTHATRSALILYNTDDRVGSREEAKAVDKNLKKVHFDVTKLKWKSALELPAILQANLPATETDCMSVLMVCVMSHGRIGTLKGSGSSIMPISNILWQLKELLPPHLPLVRNKNCHEHLVNCSSLNINVFKT